MLKVSEIFGPTIQGEGALAGRVTYFVRLGGCDFRCLWCDSLHAVLPAHRDEWQTMDEQAIIGALDKLSGNREGLVTLSGGNPALQNLGGLIDDGHRYGYTFAMETQGTVARDWFAKLDYLILSPKPPSSAMPFDPTKLEACLRAGGALGPTTIGLGSRVPRRLGPSLSLKVVVMNRADFDFAKAIYQDYARPLALPFYITPGNLTPPSYLEAGKEVLNPEGINLHALRARTERVRDWCAAELPEAHVIPQLHTLLWGNQLGV